MPALGSGKKPIKAAAVPFVPCHTQLKAFRVQLPGKTNAINAALGTFLHWPAQLTRPINASDVKTKKDSFAKSEGWMDGYNVMARELTSAERTELLSVIKDMQGGSESKECPGAHVWRHAHLHVKVKALSLPLTLSLSLSLSTALSLSLSPSHTHTHTRTPTHTPSPMNRTALST